MLGCIEDLRRLAVFQPYRDLEARDNQSLKFKWRGQESNPRPLALQAKSLTTRPPLLPFFYTPVFRRDVLWYGDVRPSGSPSVRLSVRLSIRPTLRPSGSPSAHFPHFSPTCFDILYWNFAHDFVLVYYRSSSTVVTLRQFLKELCLFVNLEYR